jgi:hypothetical protein
VRPLNSRRQFSPRRLPPRTKDEGGGDGTVASLEQQLDLVLLRGKRAKAAASSPLRAARPGAVAVHGPGFPLRSGDTGPPTYPTDAAERGAGAARGQGAQAADGGYSTVDNVAAIALVSDEAGILASQDEQEERILRRIMASAAQPEVIFMGKSPVGKRSCCCCRRRSRHHFVAYAALVAALGIEIYVRGNRF